ncbi:MAG: endonuclease/exonuclease/phosphatase family protein [Planctomycetota bacterium]|nr:endonuclease/exonuclease/phosphatase family protein [Planctomycetota bacterium]
MSVSTRFRVLLSRVAKPLMCAVLACCPASVLARPDPTPVATPEAATPAFTLVRVATFNIEDVRTDDLKNPNHPRLKKLAEIIQRIRPNVIFLNELAYDTPGAPGFAEGDTPGSNGQRFADVFLNVPQAAGLEPIKFKAFQRPVNTGVPSGFDLNKDGKTPAVVPIVPAADATGKPGKQTAEGREYGNDCWGFGMFPGQYGMALLVDERLEIDADNARTFQLYPWDYMPGNFMPVNADGTPWYPKEVAQVLRLSSKSHWDVPVKLPDGRLLHLLCSHPTPPAFDGAEKRNARRNHDEISFWIDYIQNAPTIVDDKNVVGGIPRDQMFVIVGDLNADPKRGSSYKQPARKLLGSSAVNSSFVPKSDIAIEGLEPTDTAMFKLRVDYVIPCKYIDVADGGVWRQPPDGTTEFPSDHFPVWMDLKVPAADKPASPDR